MASSSVTNNHSQRSTFTLTRPVFLIGFMGAGKSTIARRLARICGLSALDLDTYIERTCGMSASEIFSQHGEDAFRSLEVDALKEVAAMKESLIVSCGGGVISTAQARTALQTLGYTILLDVSADEAAARIADTSTRPLFQNVEDARKLCERRQPLYAECAAATIDTHQKDIGAITREVRMQLEREGVLCRQ